jgi:hypothetical protein
MDKAEMPVPAMLTAVVAYQTKQIKGARDRHSNRNHNNGSCRQRGDGQNQISANCRGNLETPHPCKQRTDS